MVSMPARQNSHLPQALYIHGAPTASPTLRSATPSPSAATWPATSCPGISGKVGRGVQSPSIACRSLWHPPHAAAGRRNGDLLDPQLVADLAEDGGLHGLVHWFPRLVPVARCTACIVSGAEISRAPCALSSRGAAGHRVTSHPIARAKSGCYTL